MKKINILFITTDQQRPEFGLTGHPCLRTPHLDALSTEGVVFNQAYTDCPVCIPARTTMITGIQSHIYGMPNYAANHRINRDREKFLGSLMTKAGYQTRLIGKTHWHTDKDFRAGFETLLGNKVRERERDRKYGYIPSHGIGANDITPMRNNGPDDANEIDWCVQKSIDFLNDERDSSQPFFLWTSMVSPHPANSVKEPYYSMYDDEDIPEPVFPEWAEDETCPYSIQAIRIGNSFKTMTGKAKRKARGVYYGMITQIDHQLGRLFGALIRNGLWDNTIIIFTTDHGEMLFDYGTCFKATFLEPSARLPFMVRLPKSLNPLQNKQSNALVELADLLPTFCDIAGIEPPDDVTGKSIIPIMTREKEKVRDNLHGQIDNSHMFHTGKYKYLYFADDGKELLFDKENDLMDEHNLADNADLINPIREEFIQHLKNENHEHLKNGKLLNLNKKIKEKDYTNVISWLGLGITGRQ